MTPQVAERLLYESEAALRLVDSLLSELEEGDSGHSDDDLATDGDARPHLSTRMVVDEIALVREDLAERRAGLERDRASSNADAGATAVRALRDAEERLDTLARKLDLFSSDPR